MFSLAYTSNFQQPIGEEQLRELVERASEKNQRLSVTGYLCVLGTQILQYLEGDEATVRDLMAVIAADERHTVVSELDLGHHDERRFPNWGMRSVTSSELSNIQLEHLVVETLAGMAQKPMLQDLGRSQIIRIANTIAKHRSRLAAG